MLKFGRSLYNTLMKKRPTEERFAIPINGDPNIKLYTKTKLLLATGYTRIVVGGRGVYIEFDPSQIAYDNIYIPDHARHKLDSNLSYYHEYRSTDKCFVKLYQQKLTVGYADYKVGMWYISPFSLITSEFDDLLLPLYIEEVKEPEGPNLFDVL